MNYNETTFFRANPYFKQHFLPETALQNRVAQKYPSQMPSGVDFTPNIGRKHYHQRFNKSQISNANILTSPEKYPFQNRIALDKTYMRNLGTIDIQGASSNTRINQSIKNKHKARQTIAQRYNQSIDLGPKTQEDRRKEVANERYMNYQSKSIQKEPYQNMTLNYQKNPEYVQPKLKLELTDEYVRYIRHNGSSNVYLNSNTQNKTRNLLETKSQKPQNRYSTIQTGRVASERQVSSRAPSRQKQKYNINQIKNESRQRSNYNLDSMKDKTSHYKQQYDLKSKYNQQFNRILKYEQMTRRLMPQPVRTSVGPNPSLSFAGQNIISN